MRRPRVSMNKSKATAKEKKRFSLDQSAKYYPIMSTKKAQSLFCVSAKMYDEVDRDILEVALNDVLNRFQAYKVRLKKGYAWHFFEHNDAPAKVFDNEALLKPINPDDTNGYWFRLSAVNNYIKLEMFHALADGNGALTFLKSIVKRYRQLCGFDVMNDDVIDWQSSPYEEEFEDSFEKNYKPISFGEMNLKALAGKVPHRIEGTMSRNGYQSSEAVADASDIVARAKEIGVTFTTYLTGALAFAIEKTYANKKPIAIMVPVNLRALYPSKTMRNFVTFARIVFLPSTCTSVESCAKEAYRQLKIETSKDKLDAFISTTVRAQKNWLLKSLPLFVKTALIRFGKLFMRSRQTMIFSNLGNVVSPEEMGVDRYILNMNVSKNNVQNLGAITTNGKTNLAFTRYIKENDLPDAFYDLLEQKGIKLQRN